MAKGKLPEGYRGVDKIIKEFRTKNPKGKIETNPVLLGDGYVIITATVTSDDGSVGSGMADADVQIDKAVEKAESGAIRRALLTLGYESVESDDAGEEEEKEEKYKERKEEKRSFKRDEGDKGDDGKDDEEEDDKEEKPRSRFGNKNSSKDSKKDDRRDSEEESDDESEEEEGKAKFKRGSRFQRN
jgi:flagellar biosynthesis GTPase FlhF